MKHDWNREYIKVEKCNTTGKWHCDGVLPHRDKNGKRKRARKRFTTKEQADRWADEQRDKGEAYLYSGAVRRTRLTDIEENDAINAINLLNAKFGSNKKNLTEAVIFYMSQFESVNKNTLVTDAIKSYLSNPKLVRTSKDHQFQFKRRLTRFEIYIDDEATLDDIESQYMEDWIYDEMKDVNDTERRNEYACLHAFYNWCFKKELCFKNPLTKVDKPNAEERVPESLSIPEVESLMSWAEKVDAGSMVPFFALGIFAAIRPEEINRLHWEDFNWDENIVSIDGKGAKRRSIDLPDTCVEWVKPYALKQGSVSPVNVRKLYDFIRALSGYRISKRSLYGLDKEGYDALVADSGNESRPRWINDAMRHTGITYYQKVMQNVGKVADWAGNSVAVIHSHYRAVKGVTDKTSKQFWAIKPTQ